MEGRGRGGDGLDESRSKWPRRQNGTSSTNKVTKANISWQIPKDECEDRIPPVPNISMIKYNSKMVEGMNCDFETPDECQWKIVPNNITGKV